MNERFKCKSCGKEGLKKELLFHDCLGGMRKSFHVDDEFMATVIKIADDPSLKPLVVEPSKAEVKAEADAAREEVKREARWQAKEEAKEETKAEERADLREAIKSQTKKGSHK